MKQGTFCWYECGTRDVEAAKSFYCGLFGWTTAAHPMPGDMGIYTMFRSADKDVGGLYQMAGEQFEGVPAHWATYVWVDDVDATVAKVADLGGEVLMGGFDVPDVGRMAVVKDPQGAVLHLYRAAQDHPEGAKECSDAMGLAPGGFCWSELSTTDVEGAKAFYAGLVGWEVKIDSIVPGRPYTTLGVGGASVGGMLTLDGPPGTPPHWMNYVTVTDVDATAAKATELGGQVIVPPTDIPNVGRFSTFADPTGAVLSVISFPTGD